MIVVASKKVPSESKASAGSDIPYRQALRLLTRAFTSYPADAIMTRIKPVPKISVSS